MGVEWGGRAPLLANGTEEQHRRFWQVLLAGTIVVAMVGLNELGPNEPAIDPPSTTSSTTTSTTSSVPDSPVTIEDVSATPAVIVTTTTEGAR